MQLTDKSCQLDSSPISFTCLSSTVACASWWHAVVVLSSRHWTCGIVSVLHQDEGWIGKSIPDAQDFPRPERFPEGEARGKSRGSREISRDFPRSWVLHPETRGISRGRSPREIPRVEGCKTHDQGKSRGRRGWISQSIPSLGGARTFSHHYQGRIDFNTDNLIPKHMRKSKIGLLEQIWAQNPYDTFFWVTLYFMVNYYWHFRATFSAWFQIYQYWEGSF